MKRKPDLVLIYFLFQLFGFPRPTLVASQERLDRGIHTINTLVLKKNMDKIDEAIIEECLDGLFRNGNWVTVFIDDRTAFLHTVSYGMRYHYLVIPFNIHYDRIWPDDTISFMKPFNRKWGDAHIKLEEPLIPNKKKNNYTAINQLHKEISNLLNQSSVIMPISLFSIVILANRFQEKLETRVLELKIENLKNALISRNGLLHNPSMTASDILDHIDKLYGDIKFQTKKTWTFPWMLGQKILELVKYRDFILHLLVNEAIISVILESKQNQKIHMSELQSDVRFLKNLLRCENIFKRDESTQTILKTMIEQEILSEDLEIRDFDMHMLLCMQLWPFIDAYWCTATTAVQMLNNKKAISKTTLMNSIIFRLRNTKLSPFIEAGSAETINNAIDLLHQDGIIKQYTSEVFTAGVNGEEFIQRISQFRMPAWKNQNIRSRL